jgi:hypothetical protein
VDDDTATWWSALAISNFIDLVDEGEDQQEEGSDNGDAGY